MSEALAQIHHWLFKKIKIVASRENLLFRNFSQAEDTVESVREMANQSIGNVAFDQALEDMIDHQNIHQWLQRQINLVETREAYIIKEFLAQMGDGARKIIEETFEKDGYSYGQEAVTFSKNVSTAPQLYQTVNDYYLNGMPCDVGDMMKEISPNHVVWENDCWPQEKNWQRAGGDQTFLENLYLIWLQAFIKGANSSYDLTFKKENQTNHFTLQKEER
ncbi:hypothetical protein [Anaerosinus massiliensis]|uniref:hypothetical protein n=1 Tax=Massilibacillus massiliensis TaxID=1806837 RepID=UPI000DA6107F|nr:hypothetical protein [Massilibacillus massiliensis]